MIISVSPKNAIETATLYPVVGTMLGCWCGCIPISLDWDRPWQVRRLRANSPFIHLVPLGLATHTRIWIGYRLCARFTFCVCHKLCVFVGPARCFWTDHGGARKRQNQGIVNWLTSSSSDLLQMSHCIFVTYRYYAHALLPTVYSY